MALASVEQAHWRSLRHLEEIVAAETLQLSRDALDLLPCLKLVVDGLQVSETDECELHRPVGPVPSLDFLLEVGFLLRSAARWSDELDNVQAVGFLFIEVIVQVVVNKVG